MTAGTLPGFSPIGENEEGYFGAVRAANSSDNAAPVTFGAANVFNVFNVRGVRRYAPAMSTDAPAPEMRRRSIYMETGAARRMNAAVDDLHHETRCPKHEVLTALVAVALDHRDEIEARLRKGAPSE